MRELKILQVGRDVVGTGAGRVILETSRIMSSQGHKVRLLTDTPVDVQCNSFLSIDITPFGPFLKQWTPRTRAGRIVRHISQLLAFAVCGTFRARYWSKRGWIVLNHNIEIFCGDVLVLHNVFSAEHAQANRPIFRKMLRWLNPVFTFRIVRERLMLQRSGSRVICAVSKATAEEAKPYIPHDVRIQTIPNGVDTEVFFPLDEEERKQVRLADGTSSHFILLFVAHSFEGKGLRPAIEALQSLPDNIRLKALGGQGSNRNKYENIAEKLAVGHRVEFLGTILDTARYYQLADAFILPSIHEAWALVGLEAMACGTPALMTDVGGIAEYLKHGENGLFIKRKPEDIAKKIKYLLENPDLLKMFSRKARDTALLYTWDTIAQQYLELGQRVFEEKERRA